MAALLWTGAAGAWLFVVTFLVDGATRPGYHPVRHPISALALGPRGWIQTTNFVVGGLMITAGAIALGNLLLAAAVAVFGLSLVASGVWPMDPMRGYPPGTPDDTPPTTSRTHDLHDRFGVAVFLALPAAAVIAAFTLPEAGWRWYSGVTGALLVAGLAVFAGAYERDDPRAGLIQRAKIVVGWSWLSALFLHATP